MSADNLALRVASANDTDDIVALVNHAFQAEAYCVTGDRTDAADIVARMQLGQFFVIDAAASSGAQFALQAVVYQAVQNGRGYLGLLSVDPALHGRGIATRLIHRVADECRAQRCDFLDITVVSVREELFPFYAKHGFAVVGEEAFPKPERMKMPLHLVKLTKRLAPSQQTKV
jgi:GNAT superfamily N-acetyltransferase